MKIVALIQARMGSTRLPGKVVKEINGLPLIVHIYRRLKACKELSDVWVAWGSNDKDTFEPQRIFEKYKMRYFRGSERDLIQRFKYGYDFHTNGEAFVLVRSDCLFIDPEVVDTLVGQFRAGQPACRGVSNWPYRTQSEGLDCEVYRNDLLLELDRTSECPREGFAAWICNDDDRAIHYKFALGMQNEKNEGLPHLSIDTQEDFDRAEKMLKILGNDEWRYEKTLEAYRKVTS